ncbi:MAG: secretin N-terminal domain-containing protein, partial [Planctomycetota bacterium]
ATDYDYNIARFEKIITTMDVKKPDIEMRMVQLRNALATDLEQMLNNLVQTIIQQSQPGRGRAPRGGQLGEQVKIVADIRTNSLVVLAEPNRLEQILELVAKLDSEAGFETSGIYILHLRHTDASSVVETLNATFGGAGVMPRGGGAGGGPAPVPRGGTGGSPTGRSPTIVADSRSNSIILVTDRNTYRMVEDIVKRLDQRRPQVLIKATVVEIRSDRDFDLGVELNYLKDPAGHRVAGFGRSQQQQTTIVPDVASGEFNVTPVDTPGITLGLMKDRIGNLMTMLKALEGKAKVAILDEPEAATVDNGSAEMKLKNQVPILQTTVTGTGIAQTTFSRFETAETTLSISPHISEGGYLRLDTTVKIEKFVKGGTTDPTIPPPKTSREIKTQSILVPNGRTVVIGGIVTQDESRSVQGIPFISSIPILGLFFSRHQENMERRTLYIFITPYILYDENFGDFKELTQARQEAIEQLRGTPMEGLNLETEVEPGAKTMFKFSGGSEDSGE